MAEHRSVVLVLNCTLTTAANDTDGALAATWSATLRAALARLAGGALSLQGAHALRMEPLGAPGAGDAAPRRYMAQVVCALRAPRHCRAQRAQSAYGTRALRRHAAAIPAQRAALLAEDIVCCALLQHCETISVEHVSLTSGANQRVTR